MKLIKSLALSAIALPFLTGCETLNQVATNSTATNSSTVNNPTTSKSTTITQTEAVTGIKQALSNGLNNSINVLSVKDGFLGNAAVKVLMPTEAQKIEQALRSVGMGALCDQFIISLNRAAEGAVKEAAPIFVSSLSQMTVTDAFNILVGTQQDAATGYFKRTTSASLTQKFSPIVQTALGQNNVNTYWTQLTTAYNALPLTSSKVTTDLNAYVTQKAIDGLFVKVAEEELKIRQNLNGSRSTGVLDKVFGWVDTQK